MAFAVMAIIGICPPADLSFSRMAAVASYPFISGICISIRIKVNCSRAKASTAFEQIGHALWGFSLRNVPYYGFWGMAHEARTDFAMLLGSIFLLIVGAGVWSLDACLRKQPGMRV